MAVYKVIQDVEAEDKLIGFLSLKGFIYAAIAAVSAFMEVRLAISGLGPAKYIGMLIFLGPMVLFGVLASPLGREQPTEVWLLSRIRFFFKPRTRVWNQSEVKNLVTITAPKRAQVQLTKNLSQLEVRSRLKALASTLDSRGWAVKSAAVDASSIPSYLTGSQDSSDRLVAPSSMPQNEPVIDVHASDDIMDAQNNPTAQKFAAMMQQADDQRKKDVTDRFNSIRAGAESPGVVDTTFLDSQGSQGGDTTFVGTRIVGPGADDGQTDGSSSLSDTEKQLLERKHREDAEIESKLPKNSNLKADHALIKKGSGAKAPEPAAASPAPKVTPEGQAAKIELAQSGNDLSVASIAQLANRVNQVHQIGPNEFEIALH